MSYVSSSAPRDSGTPTAPFAIVVADCAALHPHAEAVQFIDVRRRPAAAADPRRIPGAIWRDPEQPLAWAGQLEPWRRTIVYCVHGHEVSQGVAAALQRAGIGASYLVGGMEGWSDAGLALATPRATPTRWVTRARPKIDRIACPWAIRRFIDPDAEFLYVAPDRVRAVADETGAVPFDIEGVALSHVGERCSFDALCAAHVLNAPGLSLLAEIVRAADTGRLETAAASTGLFAVSLGLSRLIADDARLLHHGLMLYDALYTWCRDLQAEQHGWPPAG